MKAKKESLEVLKRVAKYPQKYNEAALILYLLSFEIKNLQKEIRAKSPAASKQLQANAAFAPEQIEEARKHYTGFIKQAIALIAQRQMVLNLSQLQQKHIKNLIAEIENGFALAVENPSFISPEGFKHLEKTLKTLKQQEQEVINLETALHSGAATVNELLAKHSAQWDEHHKKYVDKLIAELNQKGIVLSELEQQELMSAAKTIEEVKQNLKKQSIIKDK